MRQLLTLVLAIANSALAADWPQFRGPNGLGVSADKNLPVQFGPQKNVVWKTELPPGHSSPIVVGSRIFVTAYEGEKLLTIALHRATGKILWKREAPRPRREYMQDTNSPASGSPVSDGRSVYVFFGDFGILCYGVDGEDRWRVPLGPFNNANGHGASPVLIDDMLILICDQDTFDAKAETDLSLCDICNRDRPCSVSKLTLEDLGTHRCLSMWRQQQATG